MHRLNVIKEIIEENQLDWILINGGPNFTYLTGKKIETYERPLFLLSNGKRNIIVSPMLEKDRISQIKNAETVFYEDSQDPYKILLDKIEEYGFNKNLVGMDKSIDFPVYNKVSEKIKFKKAIDITPSFYEKRSTKSKEEIEKIRKAVEIIQEIYYRLTRYITPGLTEIDVSYSIKKWAEELGADDVLFSAVQSGPNSSIPHHERANRNIRKGDVIVVDIVVSYQGYYGDLTRVYVVGDPPQGFKEKYEAVNHAALKAIEIVRPGIKAEDVDAVARSELKGKGYAEYFIHRTGHGLGIEVHELPNIVAGNDYKLRKGNVFTIEPGIYFSGKYGIRIESNIVVTSDGHIVLDTIDRDPFYI